MKTFKWGVGAAVVTAAFILSMANTSALADTLPGSGATVRCVQAGSLGANYVADQIVARAMKSLGYDVKVSTMNITRFFARSHRGMLIYRPMSICRNASRSFGRSRSRRKSLAPGSLPGMG